MIARTYRFHGFNALRHVYARGLTVRGPVLAVKFLANPRRDSYRAAVVVSRKVNKSAVVRNRIRRRLYEIIRGLQPAMTGPYDIVITVFSDQIANMEAAQLKAMVTDQLRRAHIVAAAAKVSTGISHAIVEQSKPTGTHSQAGTKESTR